MKNTANGIDSGKNEVDIAHGSQLILDGPKEKLFQRIEDLREKERRQLGEEKFERTFQKLARLYYSIPIHEFHNLPDDERKALARVLHQDMLKCRTRRRMLVSIFIATVTLLSFTIHPAYSTLLITLLLFFDPSIRSGESFLRDDFLQNHRFAKNILQK